MANYVITKDCSFPRVMTTGNPGTPVKVVPIKMKKGQIITGGEIIKDSKGRPLQLFVKPDIMIPLVYVKEVITKDINGATVDDKSTSNFVASQPAPTTTKVNVLTNKKTKYIDGAILGGLIGIGIGYMAEKKGWLGESNDPNNKWYIAGVGALAGIYLSYRLNTREVVKNIN